VSDAEHRPALDDEAPDDVALGDEPAGRQPGGGHAPPAERGLEPSPEPGPQDDAEVDADPDPEGTAFVQVTRRRAPRYGAFVLTGVGLAVLVSLVAALVSDPADGYSQRQLFGFLLVSLGVVGAIVGGLVAVLVERRR
jgi:hypothetical protein